MKEKYSSVVLGRKGAILIKSNSIIVRMMYFPYRPHLIIVEENLLELYFTFLSGLRFQSPIKLSWIHHAKHFYLSF